MLFLFLSVEIHVENLQLNTMGPRIREEFGSNATTAWTSYFVTVDAKCIALPESQMI